MTAPGVSAAQGRLLAELESLADDCRYPGWDGYGADPVSQQALRCAELFISYLSNDLPSPTLSADPEGCVTFEWKPSALCIVLASVHPSGRVDYAALVGRQQRHGSEPLSGTLPPGLREAVALAYRT